jgi:arylsulfatase A-like enzyme
MPSLPVFAVPLLAPAVTGVPQTATKKPPDTLVTCGDGIGLWNVSADNPGTVDHRTPSLDRVAKPGALITDHHRH